MDNIIRNIDYIKSNIATAASYSGRTVEDITVIAATKTQPPEAVNALIDGGIMTAGENRAGELVSKIPRCDPRIDWHFIGQLQSNKVKQIAGKVSLIHSLDRLSLAAALDAVYSKRGERIGCLIEVDYLGIPGRGGIPAEGALSFVRHISEAFPAIEIKGIMTVMPPSANEKLYLQVKQLYDILLKSDIPHTDIRWLSVGMSGDYLTAIKFGANMVRLGTAIFGSRSVYAQQK